MNIPMPVTKKRPVVKASLANLQPGDRRCTVFSIVPGVENRYATIVYRSPHPFQHDSLAVMQTSHDEPDAAPFLSAADHKGLFHDACQTKTDRPRGPLPPPNVHRHPQGPGHLV
jgi:hypothetical protein